MRRAGAARPGGDPSSRERHSHYTQAMIVSLGECPAPLCGGSVRRATLAFRNLATGFRSELHFEYVLTRSAGRRRHKPDGVTRTEARQGVPLNPFKNVVGLAAGHGIRVSGQEQHQARRVGIWGDAVTIRIQANPSGEICQAFKRVVVVRGDVGRAASRRARCSVRKRYATRSDHGKIIAILPIVLRTVEIIETILDRAPVRVAFVRQDPWETRESYRIDWDACINCPDSEVLRGYGGSLRAGGKDYQRPGCHRPVGIRLVVTRRVFTNCGRGGRVLQSCKCPR